MYKMMIAALAALSLSACATNGTDARPAPPSRIEALAPILAPVAGHHVTAEAIDLAFAAADATLYAIDFMRGVGWIEDGSTKALALAGALGEVRRWLVLADTAQRAGDKAGADDAYAKAAAAHALILKMLER